MAEMRRTPLERDHPHKYGQELQSAFAEEMEQKIAHQNFHVSLPPAALEALMIEPKLPGFTALLRLGERSWIGSRPALIKEITCLKALRTRSMSKGKPTMPPRPD